MRVAGGGRLLEAARAGFRRDRAIYWAHLSRLTNLMVVLNISLFFLTRLVVDRGYYYTFFSLGCLAAIEIALLIPSTLLDRLWFFLTCVALELVAIYFVAVSAIYWIETGGS